MTVECVWDAGCVLGEGPVWHAGALWFVDIKARRVHRLGEDGARAPWDTPDQPGFVLPAVGGVMVVGLPHALVRFDAEAGAFAPVVAVEPERASNRINDACVSPDGALWFGTMDDGEAAPTGALYRWAEGGLTRHADGVAITNGPAFSPDGRTFYFTDTLARTVYAYDHAEGALTRRRVLIAIEAGAGWPDGTTVDAEGCLWVGLWGGWAVRRYSPVGVLLETVRLPAANVTKIAFGGANLRTAYATTARKGLNAAALEAQPLAGGVFAFGVDTPGMETPRARL